MKLFNTAMCLLWAAGAASARPDMSHPPATGSMKPYRAPRRARFSLSNGLPVVFIEDHRQPLITARLAFEGGTSLVSREIPGLVQALSELMTEGTENKSAKEIAEEADAFGGALDVRVSRDHLILRAFSLSENSSRMFDLLADVALRPSFPESEVNLRKKNMVEELRLERSQARFLSSVVFNRRLYGDHPYAVISPTEDSIAQIDRERIRALHEKLISADRGSLVVVGDISLEKIKVMLEERFSKIGRSSEPLALPAPVDPDAAPERTVVLYDRAGSEQTSLLLGNIALSENHPDYYRLLLANQILGGSFAARLSTDLREKKGYTYGIYSGLGTQVHGGSFVVSTQVRNEVTRPAITAIIAHLERMRAEPVSESELSQAKNMLIGEFVRELETQAGLAGSVLHGLLRGLPEDYLDTYIENVSAVTVEDVGRAAKKYMLPGRLVIAVVGDAAQIETKLEDFSDGPPIRVGVDGRPSARP